MPYETQAYGPIPAPSQPQAGSPIVSIVQGEPHELVEEVHVKDRGHDLHQIGVSQDTFVTLPQCLIWSEGPAEEGATGSGNT